MKQDDKKDCSGEVASIAYASIESPIGANITYHKDCQGCGRFGGAGRLDIGYKGDFVAVLRLEQPKPEYMCKNLRK